jgi:hypothetical protein
MNERLVNLASLPDAIRWGALFATIEDHAERYEILEKILDRAYEQLTDGRQHFAGLSEDAITQIIVGNLRDFGIIAHHDAQIGGHIDILVEASNGFRWIGEAKLDNGPAYILGGYDQLTTRYAVARPGADRGEVLIYCFKSRADMRLNAWRDKLLSERQVTLETDTGVE